MNTSTGLPRNTAAALSYVLGPVTGLIFAFVEKDKFVRFHAFQSVVFSSVFWFLAWFFGRFALLGFLSSLFWLSWFALMLFLIVQAHSNLEYELPVAGAIARKLLRRV